MNREEHDSGEQELLLMACEGEGEGHYDSDEDGELRLLYSAILTFLYIYHMIIHLRELYMNQSRQRLQMVLTGALNNLRGIPGDGYADHLFAYTDLGTHLLAFVLSGKLLHMQNSLHVALYYS